MQREINSLRRLHLVFGMLSWLKNDPYCSKCQSFVKGVEKAKDEFMLLERSVNARKLSGEMKSLLFAIYTVLADLDIPDLSQTQKRANHCRLPNTMCLPEVVFTVYKKIDGKPMRSNSRTHKNYLERGENGKRKRMQGRRKEQNKKDP